MRISTLAVWIAATLCLVLGCGVLSTASAQDTPELRQRNRVQGISDPQTLVQPTAGMTALVAALEAHLAGQKPKASLPSMLLTPDERILVLRAAGSTAPAEGAQIDARQRLLLTQLEDLHNKIARVEIRQVERITGNNGLVAYRVAMVLTGKEANTGGNLRALAVEVGSGFKWLMLDN